MIPVLVLNCQGIVNQEEKTKREKLQSAVYS